MHPSYDVSQIEVKKFVDVAGCSIKFVKETWKRRMLNPTQLLSFHVTVVIMLPGSSWCCWLQIAFTLVFWLTLRQFTLEYSTDRRGSRLDAESLQTLDGTDGII